MKKTKIVCTLGPASDSCTELTALIQAGMNVARLNFSHGNYQHHQKIIKNLRQAAKDCDKDIAILQDLQGPKIRTGEMPEQGLKIKKGDKVYISVKKMTGFQDEKGTHISSGYKGIIKDVKKGDSLLIDDGLIELKVNKVSQEIECTTKHGGTIKSRKGINIPTATISAKTITTKDKEDLEFGLKHDVDYVALSFVKDSKDIKDLKKLIAKKKKKTKVIAKIERKEAVANLEEIVVESDGVMVARGDLALNVTPEQVPIIQKKIIYLANIYGKPVITATQVLHSMIENPVPTRAEVSDAANAVFDHTDAIMLSNESSVGKFPAKATRVLSKVAKAVEKELEKERELVGAEIERRLKHSENATCINACELALDGKAKKIIIYTEDGYTARHIAKHRIYTPLIVITPNAKTKRELALIWGINQILEAKLDPSDSDSILQFLKKEKKIKKGEKILLVCNASKKEKILSTIKV